MLTEEAEQAKQKAIILNNDVLLRSSQYVSTFQFINLLGLPQYHLFHNDLVRAEKLKHPVVGHTIYNCGSCAVWEVLYLDARAPSQPPDFKERRLEDIRTIVDAIQQVFPAFDSRSPLRESAEYLLGAHYENANESNEQKVKKSGIIRKIDGVFGLDPDFRKQRLLDYGPQKADAQKINGIR